MDQAFINASGWATKTCLHYIICSPQLALLDHLSQAILYAQGFCPKQIDFKSIYTAFSCLVYDCLSKEYTLIRDHFGLEPFYYTLLEDNVLCFGSTLPEVLAHMSAPKLDQRYVEALLQDICISNMTYSENTFYQEVFRVTPGEILHISVFPKIKINHSVYWTLTPDTPFIQYSSDEAYDAQFASLLEEACRHATQQGPVAMEFSGGLDTSVILTAMSKQQLPVQLFMHIGEIKDERAYGEQLLKMLPNAYPVSYVDATAFELEAVLDQHKAWFAGGAPYLFFMFAANIHAAVQQGGYQTLVSGFGGDECVSSHAPLRAWSAQVHFYSLLKAFPLTQWPHVLLWKYPQFTDLIRYIKTYRSPLMRAQHPIHYKRYDSLQAREADWLTGSLSYHVRMRIEYSAVVAKYRGFHYQYPLLYPPLVMYCFRLPPEQKRRQQQQRLLVRRYLAQSLSTTVFDHHKKCGDILPGTLPDAQQLYQQGKFNSIFQSLPFANVLQDMIKNKVLTEDRFFHLDVLRYMFNGLC